MTEEELNRARKLDHMRYAKKAAAQKAAEEARRAAILKGAVYEVSPQKSKANEAAQAASESNPFTQQTAAEPPS